METLLEIMVRKHILTVDEMPSHTHVDIGGTGSQCADYQTSFHVDRDPDHKQLILQVASTPQQYNPI